MLHQSQFVPIAIAGYVAGIFLAPVVTLPLVWVIFISAAVLAAITTDWFRAAALFVLTAAIGYHWTTIALEPAQNPYDQYIDVRATVVQEPELRVQSQRLVVQSAALDGYLQLHVPLQPRWQVGDVVQVQCQLRQPEAFDGFAYDRYLQRFSISGLCYYPRLELIDHRTNWKSRLFAAKHWLRKKSVQAIPVPESSIILGALFGEKRAVPEDIQTAFRSTGTAHMLVISGMHMAIISTLVLRLLQTAGLSRRPAAVGLLAILSVYVLLTGLQPSAIRAGCFAGTTIAAEFVARRAGGLRVLVLVAAAMLAANPLLLLYDVAFQLSVSATAGILLLTRPVEIRLTFLPTRFGIRQIAAVSIAAYLATMPLSVYHFGQLSLIAIVVNVVLVPWMPAILGLGIATTVLAAVYQPLAFYTAVPLYYLLHWLIAVVEWAAQFTFAVIQF